MSGLLTLKSCALQADTRNQVEDSMFGAPDPSGAEGDEGFMRKTFIAIALVAVVALVAGPATAGGAKGSRYQGTLSATPNVLHAGDSFTVTGCGYDTYARERHRRVHRRRLGSPARRQRLLHRLGDPSVVG